MWRILVFTMFAIVSLFTSAQTNSFMYFGDVPMGIHKKGFKERMERSGYKYKEECKKAHTMFYKGEIFSVDDIIVAEYSPIERIGKVSVITPNRNNYNDIVNTYTEKYDIPITNNDCNVMYNTENGYITITYDDESIIITYYDSVSYSDMVTDRKEHILPKI